MVYRWSIKCSFRGKKEEHDSHYPDGSAKKKF